MDKQIFDAFYEKFKLNERRGTGNQVFKYVTNEDVKDRMNRIFQGSWSTEVMHTEVIEDQVLVRVRVMVREPGTDDYFFHEGFGGHPLTRYKDGPNQGKIIDLSNGYKSALSKAIVSACSCWGVGLYKEFNPYDESYEPEITSQITPQQIVTGAPMAPPPGVSIPRAEVKPVVPFAIPTVEVVVPPTPPAPEPKPAPVVVAPAPAPAAAPAPRSTTMSPPPGVVIPGGGVPKLPIDPGFTNQKPAPVVSAPAPAAPMAPPPNVDLPFSTDVQYISDVQKAALNAILSIRKVNYTELAAEAFANAGINKPVPEQDKLVYDDAVVVIKYGNDKYRNKR